MYFMPRVIFRAQQRQSRRDGTGYMCARCGTSLSPLMKTFTVARVPAELGGKGTINNCAVLCRECHSAMGQQTTRVIPCSSLPFFEA